MIEVGQPPGLVDVDDDRGRQLVVEHDDRSGAAEHPGALGASTVGPPLDRVTGVIVPAGAPGDEIEPVLRDECVGDRLEDGAVRGRDGQWRVRGSAGPQRRVGRHLQIANRSFPVLDRLLPGAERTEELDARQRPGTTDGRDEQVRRVVPDVRLVGIGQVEPHPGRARIAICHVPFARERGARRPLARRPEPSDRVGLGRDRGVVDEARSRREQRAPSGRIAIGHEHVDENLERLHHAPFRRAPRITEGNRNRARLGYGPGP